MLHASELHLVVPSGVSIGRPQCIPDCRPCCLGDMHEDPRGRVLLCLANQRSCCCSCCCCCLTTLNRSCRGIEQKLWYVVDDSRRIIPATYPQIAAMMRMGMMVLKDKPSQPAPLSPSPPPANSSNRSTNNGSGNNSGCSTTTAPPRQHRHDEYIATKATTMNNDDATKYQE